MRALRSKSSACAYGFVVACSINLAKNASWCAAQHGELRSAPVVLVRHVCPDSAPPCAPAINAAEEAQDAKTVQASLLSVTVLSVLPRSKDCIGKIVKVQSNFWQARSRAREPHKAGATLGFHHGWLRITSWALHFELGSDFPCCYTCMTRRYRWIHPSLTRSTAWALSLRHRRTASGRRDRPALVHSLQPEERQLASNPKTCSHSSRIHLGLLVQLLPVRPLARACRLDHGCRLATCARSREHFARKSPCLCPPCCFRHRQHLPG